jgi:hypothetical protein
VCTITDRGQRDADPLEGASFGILSPSVMLSAMDEKTTSMERAFELAKSGLCNSVTDIERSLKAEGYSCQQLTGLILRKQLSTLIRNSKE